MSSTDSSPSTQPQSPVALDSLSLERVLLKDVRELTDPEIDSLILTFRNERQLFLQKEQTKTPRAKAQTPKAAASAELAGLIKDLDLGL